MNAKPTRRDVVKLGAAGALVVALPGFAQAVPPVDAPPLRIGRRRSLAEAEKAIAPIRFVELDDERAVLTSLARGDIDIALVGEVTAVLAGLGGVEFAYLGRRADPRPAEVTLPHPDQRGRTLAIGPGTSLHQMMLRGRSGGPLAFYLARPERAAGMAGRLAEALAVEPMDAEAQARRRQLAEAIANFGFAPARREEALA